MAKRKRIKVRRDRAGRRIYYPRFAHSKASEAPPRKILMMELAGKQRITSEANLKAREKVENKLDEMREHILHLYRKEPEERAKAREQADRYARIEDMERHILMFNGLSRVRILFYNKQRTRWWFVERDLIRGEMRKSIEYGSREQAFAHHETEQIKFVE